MVQESGIFDSVFLAVTDFAYFILQLQFPQTFSLDKKFKSRKERLFNISIAERIIHLFRTDVKDISHSLLISHSFLTHSSDSKMGWQNCENILVRTGLYLE